MFTLGGSFVHNGWQQKFKFIEIAMQNKYKQKTHNCSI